MKKQIALLSTVGLFAGAAHAQSSVTLYGILDAGVNYISNDNGHANYTMTTGVLNGNRWGLKGVEDLGGGLKALFQLENGFSLASGALAQNRMFARQAFMGLSSARFGTLTFGRQYDSGVDYVVPLGTSNLYIGLGHPFDNDNTVNSFRLNNSVKYASPDFGGLKFGGLYAFSNAPSSDNGSGFASNRAWSLGASYTAGPLAVGASYMRLSTPGENAVGAVSGDYINLSTTSALGSLGLTRPVTGQEVIGAGASYQFSAVKAAFVYTHTKFTTSNDKLQFSNYDFNVGYYVRPDVLLAASYVFTDGKLDASGASPKYHQAALFANYLLSKRTDVYLLGMYQRAAGDAQFASIAPDTIGAGGSYAPDASTSKNQVLVRLGMRHRF